MSEFHYIDPRGRRSGPYSEAELKVLSQRGLLEDDGEIEIAGLANPWKVMDVPWLRGTGVAPTAGPEVGPPPDAMRATENDAPPRTAEAAAARIASAPQPVVDDRPNCARVVYVVLAILPAFVGIFGIHNLVAGYFARGIVALVLSVFTFMGACMIVMPPCACIGAPIWLVLFVMGVVEAITVTTDARGRPFA
jgi:hypothetical protein